MLLRPVDGELAVVVVSRSNRRVLANLLPVGADVGHKLNLVGEGASLGCGLPSDGMVWNCQSTVLGLSGKEEVSPEEIRANASGCFPSLSPNFAYHAIPLCHFPSFTRFTRYTPSVWSLLGCCVGGAA